PCYDIPMTNTPTTYEEVLRLTRENIKRFQKIEERDWGAEGALIELAKQVGELAKLIMVQEKYYLTNRAALDKQYEAGTVHIGEELGDIYFVLIRLADHYGIDFLQACYEARKEEDGFLKTKGA
ncbi:MAG: MazG-like family protein, partial [Patescibacteria group bacterium]